MDPYAHATGRLDVEVQPLPGRKEWVELFVNGELFRKLHTSIFWKSVKYPEECSSIEEFEEAFKALEFAQVKRYVLWLLGRQAMASFELARKLRDKGVDASVIDQILAYCIDSGFLDDEEWLRVKLSGYERKGVAPLQIIQKLRQKGAPSEMIEEAREKGQGWQKQGIEQFIAKKFKEVDLGDFKTRQKVKAALFRKGFDADQIEAVLREE